MVKLVKLSKLIKVLAVVVYILIFVGLVLLQVWSNVAGYGFSVSSYIYWFILFGWVFLIWNFRWKSSVPLALALMFFLVAATLTTFGLRGPGEIIMRISFIGWLVGIVQGLVEYRRTEGRKQKAENRDV